MDCGGCHSRRAPLHKADRILLAKEVEESVSNVYELSSVKQIVRYFHACAGFPSKSTWINDIKRELRNMALPHFGGRQGVLPREQ